MKISTPIKPTLFHNQFWSSSKPAYVLKALGLVDGKESSKVTIQTINEKQLKEDPVLTTLNPQCRLPFFYDPIADLRLNESSGLIEYLLETYDMEHQLWPAPGDPTRAEFLKLVAFGPGTAYHICVPILFAFMEPSDPSLKTSPEMLEKKKQEWHKIVAPTYEYALTKYGGPFLLGEKFTAADIVTGYDLMTVSFAEGCDGGPKLIQQHPQIQKYFDHICQCPIYKELYSTPAPAPAPTTDK
jgi:glutathione S-transferase